MVTVIYNDLTRLQWVQRLLPWRWSLIPRSSRSCAGWSRWTRAGSDPV